MRDEATDRVLEDLRLMISELLTNSVRHAGLKREDRIELCVNTTPRKFRVEVIDPGPGFQAPSELPTLYQDSGWGLFLVGRLADRWGVDYDGHTRVWFEIDRSSGRE